MPTCDCDAHVYDFVAECPVWCDHLDDVTVRKVSSCTGQKTFWCETHQMFGPGVDKNRGKCDGWAYTLYKPTHKECDPRELFILST